jgi:hypothetical protein
VIGGRRCRTPPARARRLSAIPAARRLPGFLSRPHPPCAASLPSRVSNCQPCPEAATRERYNRVGECDEHE